MLMNLRSRLSVLAVFNEACRLAGAFCPPAPGAGTSIELAIRQALADGELEFLEGRWLALRARYWPAVVYPVVDGRLVVSQQADADVSFSADASDLLMIAARKQDPDTLFFQRRLVIEGDTELGLRREEPDGCHRAGADAESTARHAAADGGFCRSRPEEPAET